MTSKLLPYIHLLRLHRPLPILLLLWPTYWALWIAAGGMPPLKILVIFTLGILLMRSVGGVVNDMADYKLDCLVERTKMRPITSGKLTLKQAFLVAAVLSLIAFGLVCLLNPLTIMLSFCALALAIFYPFAKRFTYWPQAVLGVAYNFGIIMAFAAIQSRVPAIAWAFLGIALVWTLSYDTIYALADREDDTKIGIRSTAVLFGKNAQQCIIGFQCLTLAGLLAVGWILGFGPSYYLSLLVCALLFIFQHRLINKHNSIAYTKAFSDNHWVGLAIWIGIVMQLGFS
ncbi:MAG: 4-hydroxybenzoate octaprenyltransferase [Gammaproteobacteria bacterium]|nr:4-hydroxybenzoate octaprenyltransferase [Gammaproteobacteria bacterium]